NLADTEQATEGLAKVVAMVSASEEARSFAECSKLLESRSRKALDHIDKVIKTIKQSKDTPTAHANLRREFKFSDKQATAILEMRLQKLAGLERKQVEDELEEKRNLIKV
ncbi:MAG: hypothetical protein IIC24_04345, partial [Chloroflexi bacterium]|nr:hypothetical protein [Chloroflexota bacterium]